MKRSVVLALTLLACKKPAVETADAAPAASVVAAPVVSSAPPAVSSAPPVVAATGTVQLVLQSVDSVCMAGPGEALQRGKIGTDVLVEITEEGAKKPEKLYAFCPKPEKGKPRLQTWENCSAFSSCKVSDETAADCGKEHVFIDTSTGKTILHGSFGEREIAPHPMKILPTKKAHRDANVDC